MMQPWSDFLRDNPKAAHKLDAFCSRWPLREREQMVLAYGGHFGVGYRSQYIPRYPHQCLALIEELGWATVDLITGVDFGEAYKPILTVGKISACHLPEIKHHEEGWYHWIHWRDNPKLFYGDSRHQEALQYVLKEEFGE